MQAGLIFATLLPPMLVFTCLALYGVLSQRSKLKRDMARFKLLNNLSKGSGRRTSKWR